MKDPCIFGGLLCCGQYDLHLLHLQQMAMTVQGTIMLDAAVHV